MREILRKGGGLCVWRWGDGVVVLVHTYTCAYAANLFACSIHVVCVEF